MTDEGAVGVARSKVDQPARMKNGLTHRGSTCGGCLRSTASPTMS